MYCHQDHHILRTSEQADSAETDQAKSSRTFEIYRKNSKKKIIQMFRLVISERCADGRKETRANAGPAALPLKASHLATSQLAPACGVGTASPCTMFDSVRRFPMRVESLAKVIFVSIWGNSRMLICFQEMRM